MALFPVNNSAPSDNGSGSKPAADLSARVVELARIIDRLPPGTFEITIKKSEVRAQDWHVEIIGPEKVQNIRLSKYRPE